MCICVFGLYGVIQIGLLNFNTQLNGVTKLSDKLYKVSYMFNVSALSSNHEQRRTQDFRF